MTRPGRRRARSRHAIGGVPRLRRLHAAAQRQGRRVCILQRPAIRARSSAAGTANHERGVGVLLVDQHVHRALEVAGRAYPLQRGRFVLSAPAADLHGRMGETEASHLATPVEPRTTCSLSDELEAPGRPQAHDRREARPRARRLAICGDATRRRVASCLRDFASTAAGQLRRAQERLLWQTGRRSGHVDAVEARAWAARMPAAARSAGCCPPLPRSSRPDRAEVVGSSPVSPT
jgi:hypothetical protein